MSTRASLTHKDRKPGHEADSACPRRLVLHDQHMHNAHMPIQSWPSWLCQEHHKIQFSDTQKVWRQPQKRQMQAYIRKPGTTMCSNITYSFASQQVQVPNNCWTCLEDGPPARTSLDPSLACTHSTPRRFCCVLQCHATPWHTHLPHLRNWCPE